MRALPPVWYRLPTDLTTTKCAHEYDARLLPTEPSQDHRPRAARPSATPAQPEPSYRQGIEPGYLGPTNLSQQIRDHCITTLNGADRIRTLEHRLDVFSHAFEGYQDTGRLIGRQPEIGESARRRTLAAATYSRVEERLMRELGSETILIDLMTTCQHAFIPLFPAVLGSRGPSPDFYAHFGIFHVNSTPPTPLPPVLRLILCAIPAMSRQVPPAIRDGILSGLNTALDSMDFSLGMGSLARIQLHLLLSVNDGLWRRGPMGRPVYAATRMAMGLALHRNVSSRITPVAQLQCRSRIWGACIIADRWITLRLGQMPSIDLAFADAPWPSPGPDHIPTTDFGVIPCFRYHLEMTKLADLLGRAYLATGTPFSLKNTDDFALLSWQMDFESWQAQLPETWPYSYRLDVPQARPILDLLSIGLMYTFAHNLVDALMGGESGSLQAGTLRPTYDVSQRDDPALATQRDDVL
ncbi:hypothetical protein EHS25_000020 [Saitozyma podzolica]|uniref:Xylanolytic transcriptional activator regulatory domain-containing protein n=1 Tax=Saitozyma podzolica TaxID=1890683 RepID=A0A427YV70_9TREE|nr:hypothetical protein EHS25_000020 [Saitozyma podzolica]